MHGIVNKAIQGLVIENYGEATWNEIKIQSETNIDFFIAYESYDDSITFKLATSAAKVLKISVSEVLQSLGEYWILKTGQKHYGSLMKTGGNSLKEFLINLPNFHSRVMLMFPNINPPEFKITNVAENNLSLHYYSSRSGLADFVIGLLHGIGKMFDNKVTIITLNSREQGDDHEIFKVNW